MRSIWKGSISFGLVNIAVKLYSATEEKDIAFHQVHRTDGGRIRYRRVCSVDGEEVAYNDIAKGFELPDGDMVVLTDDDLAELPLTTSREIDVLQFVPLEQVDPIYFSKSYYLEPEARAAKAYVLLRDTLSASGKVAIVKVALRRREALATLRVRDGVLTMETMLWPDEIRKPDFAFLEEASQVRHQELAMAASLVESLSGDFDPTDYTDHYREALDSLIEAKIEGRDLVPAPEAAEVGTGGKVVDLVAALQASIDAAKHARAGGTASDIGRAGGTASDIGRAAEVSAVGDDVTARSDTAESGSQEARRTAKQAPPKKAAGKKTAATTATAATKRTAKAEPAKKAATSAASKAAKKATTTRRSA